VAAKTGTSQSYFDNWAVGYTREVTVGVWVGNFDRTPLRGSSGVTGAGPIFHAVMLAAVERVHGQLPADDSRPLRTPPADVVPVDICAMSGLPAGDACPTRVREWLPPDRAAGPRCTWHHASDEGLITVYPEVYRQWAREQGLLDRPGASPTPGAAGAPAGRPASLITRVQAAHDGLTIVRPLGGALFLVDTTLRREFQAVTLAARGGTPGPLAWFVDGAPAGIDRGGDPLRWPLVRGRHRIEVRDSDGHTADTFIDVR
jgi:penicillin-binding protein 1C